MAMELIDGKIVADFIADAAAFNRAADEFFAALDVDGDGRLCRSELFTGFDGLFCYGEPPELSESTRKDAAGFFARFESDETGMVGREEFRFRLRELMAAVAQGLGEVPVQIALYEGSVLMKAVEHSRSAPGSGPGC
ncbi:hypothetical protein ACMD2_07075 [Ananas comosus]|uniref:EF-hand domain-containing protein n=2 Tax=Ananas comosus TaxID=4615 RepID=A0A199VUX0_ANACO|nr:hypothetical protein ACMD2_07075 [Ananas comosus]CAD1837992.1 unnamed protein product [Ananas comosus var. bracteatus]